MGYGAGTGIGGDLDGLDGMLGEVEGDLESAIAGPYKPSTLLDLPEVLTMALRAARHFEADFEDKEAVRRVGALQKDLGDVEAAVFEAQQAVSSGAAPPSVAQALSAGLNRLSALRRSLDAALKNKAAKYRRNLRDAILRVTLLQGASNVNALAGDIAGEGLDVARPGLVCTNCGNAEEGSFLSDPKQADTICTRCGLVVADNAARRRLDALVRGGGEQQPDRAATRSAPLKPLQPAHGHGAGGRRAQGAHEGATAHG